MELSIFLKLTFIFLLNWNKFGPSDAGDCQMLSIDVGCPECTYNGHCVPGSVPVDTWTSFALQTQRELQIDEPFYHVSILDAHNAYNNRADGYGKNDTCAWPPPYNELCLGVANQEFSITDMLNMGIRGVELDNWFCKEEMRLAHLGTDLRLACQEDDKLFSEGIKEIADWLNKETNLHEIVRIYINEKQDQGHDELVNGPIEEYLGSRVFTPRDLNETYGGVWPTIRQLRKDGKNVVIATGSTAGSGELYTHGDVFIHKLFWSDRRFKLFTPYPECGGKTDENAVRYYSDSTHWPLISDGPTNVGVVTDYWELLKCRIQYPAGDHVNPQLMKTAVFTWAEGEPSSPLLSNTCVMMKGTDNRWYVGECDEEMYYACQHVHDLNNWILSEHRGPYTLTEHVCPPYYKFTVPQNGYRHQKLIEASRGESVWINYSPWLPYYEEPSLEPLTTPKSGSATMHVLWKIWIVFAAATMTNLILWG